MTLQERIDRLRAELRARQRNPETLTFVEYVHLSRALLGVIRWIASRKLTAKEREARELSILVSDIERELEP